MRGAWPVGLAASIGAGTGMTESSLASPAASSFRRSEGVLGATGAGSEVEVAGVGAGADGPSVSSGAAIPATGELLYRALEPAPADRLAPNVLRLFAVGAVAPDGVPLERFTSPLTLTVPFVPETTNGWLALAAYDPTSGGWIELPVRAVGRQRSTISAQLPQPAVIALLENRPPLPTPDAAETEMDIPVTLDVMANDADPDGDALGAFERTTLSAAGGDVRCTQAGACTYTPPPGFEGEDTFIYGLGDLRVQAWSDNTAEGTVTVLVRATPDR